MAGKAVRYLGVVTAMVTGILLFQNCSGDGFQSQAAAALSQTSGSNTQSSNLASNGSGNAMAAPTTIGATMVLEDASVMNATVVTRIKQKIYNAHAGLLGCTGTIANYNSVCLKDSEFILITSAGAWGANAYNAATDVYSVDMDVSAYGWPATTYFTRYIAADGSRREFIFTPGKEFQTKPARLQWVFTNPQACVGPSPGPASIGESCSIQGETRSNACGTATCEFK